ncbi:MAG: 16S rRNA (guanine(527)-N(7))-methyltransferase RsmG [Chloroflexi bacterium]|nr:MAG: 16S rRNA (guanine(527)-N(7))-methyltransferase RsmG [Chloroflexota bacterium]
MSTLDDLSVLDGEAARVAVVIDARAHERFARYLALLEEWDGRAGLTAITDPAEVQRRHFGESLALLAVLRAEGLLPVGEARALADLGTGAGFPGLPMLIAEPALRLTLIESNGRRCRFLETVAQELALDGVRVVQSRAEEAGRDPALRATFDVVVARALAALPVLVEYALPLLQEDGVLAAPKGSRADEERAEAEAALRALGGTVLASRPLPLDPSMPPQVVLLVRRSGPLDDRYPRRAGLPTQRPLR